MCDLLPLSIFSNVRRSSSMFTVVLIAEHTSVSVSNRSKSIGLVLLAVSDKSACSICKPELAALKGVRNSGMQRVGLRGMG